MRDTQCHILITTSANGQFSRLSRFLKDVLDWIHMRDQTSSMSNHVLAETLGSPGQSTTRLLEHGVAGFKVSEFLAQVVNGMLFSLCLVLLSKDTTHGIF